MWGFYGTTSPTPETITEPLKIPIFDFKPSSNISEADFNNASINFLAQNLGTNTPPLITYPTGNNKSTYYSGSAHDSNLLAYTRFNIVHRHYKDGGVTYDYDGCAFTWAFHQSGTNVYYWDAYRAGDLTYAHCPAVYFRPYTNAEITRDRVKSMSLVATRKEAGSTEIGTVRPLWTVDFTGVSGFDNVGEPVQSFLGPVIHSATITEWMKYVEDEDRPDSPMKPLPDPTTADQHEGISAGWTWLNKFKIINLPELPEKFLIDGGWENSSKQPYLVWNNENDIAEFFHINTVYTNAEGFEAMRAVNRNINLLATELGSSVTQFYDTLNGNEGYFATGTAVIDNYTGGEYDLFHISGPDTVEAGDITLNASYLTGYVMNPLRLETDDGVFSVSSTYSNNTIQFSTGGNGYYSFMDCYICRCGDHYYLGGPFKFGNGYVTYGFAILCRIDNLDELSNYGGDNPEDPQNAGISTDDLNDTFGDGSYTAPNNTTEKDINDKIGTSPINDGSAYNPDGSPRDPGDAGMGDSTGEKETNPVDSHQVPNTHDGSMGNGTGDLHQDDTHISDPESTIPEGIDTPGTVSGSGVLSVFTPSWSQLQIFTSELLSNSVLSAIHNYFTTNPMDGIFGLHMLPYSGFASATTANPRIGTHNFASILTLAAKEFMTVDYGTINVPFVYNGFENYAPLSDAKIFLPFLGMKDIDINIIQGCNINLKYIVSLTTGDIYAYLYAQWASSWGNGDTTKGVNHLIYHWQGNCAATIPLSHLDNTNYISGAMQVAGGITSLVTGAATANPAAIASGIGATAAAASEFGRTSLITSGNLSGMAAFMGCREPYLLLSRPIIAFSDAYNHYLGQRSNAVQAIGQLRPGTFTKMINIDLSGVGATDDELAEIDSILKGGFYV